MGSAPLADPVVQAVTVTRNCASFPLNPTILFAAGFVAMDPIGMAACWVGAKARSARAVTHFSKLG